MSCGPAKYVKFRHRTLLFYATQSEATVSADSRSRSLSSTLGGNRAARAVRRCSGLTGLSGLRFSLLGVFEVLLCGHYCGEARRLCGEIRPPPWSSAALT
jgi:hypothetical protein